MPPKDASKKKKRIAPQLIGPVQGAGGGPANGSAPFGAGPPGGVAAAGGGAGSSSGYKRLRIAVSDPGATVKQLKAAVKDHNSRYCVPVSGRKADLKARMTRVSGGGTAGQRAAAKKLHKIASQYGGLNRDANPELAF